MATVIGVGMQMTANAAGMTAGLSEADKALQLLQKIVDQGQQSLKKFSGEASGVSAAQQKLATDSQFLASAFRTGQISSQQFAEQMQALAQESADSAAAFAEGARVTASVVTTEEKRAAQLEKLQALLAAGAISQETFARASAEASGANERAAAAAQMIADEERKKQAVIAEGAAVAASVATSDEKRSAELDRLQGLLESGAISEEVYARAVDKASGASTAAADAERERQAILAEGKRVEDSVATTEEKRAAELERLQGLLDSGAISQETFRRAAQVASGATEQAAAAEKERAAAAAAASRIIQANLTPQEKYSAQMVELEQHLQAGRLSQDQFNRAAESAKKDLAAMGNAADGTNSKLDSLLGNVRLLSAIEVGRLVVDGVQLLANAFTSAAQNVLSLAGNVSSSLDTLNDLSARTGIGVESLQGYSLAAKLAGVDTEAFGSAVQKLAVNIGKAAPGDALDKSLRQINLSVADLRVLAPEEQFSAIGNAIAELPTAADRAAAAVEIFGKQGAALAPLFREGAASIEELKAQAERLGIIVSETQINNVADMNDAFDLVRATVEGIIGQVIGNLGPAVADVTNQFLKFVEEWSGAQGTGGTGIANAITDVLLNGAEIFAGVFDQFSANFGGFVETFSFAADVFSVTSNILMGAAESLRVIFNLFQIGIDTLLVGFGKLLEALGSWVSDDLQQFGAGLAAASEASARQNAAEMEAAAANAAQAFNNVFDGGTGNAAANGAGAAQQYVEGFRNSIEEARKPEIQVATNIDDVRERLNAYLEEAGAGASDFLQQSVQTLETFQGQVDAGGLVAGQMQVMNGFAERLNAELDKELLLRQQDAEAAAAQADADAKRVEGMLKTSDAASKLQEDLAAVERERQRIESAGGEDAQARLEQLDALKAKIEEQQQALDQGFGESFQKAFEGADKAIDTAINKAAEFGQAGYDAAQALADGIAEAQRQAEAGILNKEAYDSEVERQQRIFDQRIKDEQEAAKERDRLAEESKKLREAQEKTVNDLIFAQQYNGDSDRIKAAENLVALNAEITRAEEAAAAAREAGDQEALAAASARIQQLDQVQAKEQDIASGVAGERKKYEEEIKKQQEAAGKAQQKQQEAYLQEQAKAAEERRKAEEAEYQRQVARINELNTLGPQTVQTADIRTQEGAALVLGLLANEQDPALIEARLQTKQLQLIAKGLAQAASNYFNKPVAIVGSAQLG